MVIISAIVTGLLSIYLIYRLYQFYKVRPDMFSRESFSKSFMTLGLLALFLIGVVFFLVELIR